MTALLIFHFKAGIRIAVRSFVPIFSALLAWIMLNIDPAALVTSLARTAFARHPSIAAQLPVALLAFLLPAWAAPKLINGLNGWMRHLPFDGAGNRRGMELALVVVQLPLAVSLAGLGFVAHTQGMDIALPSLRWLLVLISASMASLPVARTFITVPLSLGSALLVLAGDWLYMLPAVALMVAAEVLSGPLHEVRRSSRWRAAARWLNFRIAWRALGWWVSAAYIAALLPLAATVLFIRNNSLPPALAGGAARLGGSFAVVMLLAGLAGKLAVHRPAWPLSRSFPWSSSQRVAADAMFLSLHALVPVAFVAMRNPGAAACTLGLLPFLALRAAAYVRMVPQLRGGMGRFLVEGSAAAALLSLLPWTALVGMAAAPAAFAAARKMECSIKVTCWSDFHHSARGDTLSWSEE
jgi:hypothetical protein